MKMIFLGPPGAGKGTSAAKISQLLNLPHISTGVLFREAVAKQSSFGLRIEKMLEQGELISDAITIAMVQERLKLSDIANGFILDGFPRSIPQAENLEKIISLDYAINFLCPTHILKRRLTGRHQCPQCGKIYHRDFMSPSRKGYCNLDETRLVVRKDDRLKAVRNRLKIYHRTTEPLIEWYQKKNLIRNIQADRKPEEIIDAIKETIGL